MSKDEFWMERALLLAEKGRGWTSPNPLVGALVVAKGRPVAEGFHARLGGPHAEVVALRRSGRRAKGATLYVTLEPCVHVGRTGPCTEAILKSGVKRVVAAMKDPNPLVSGRGLRRLRRAGLSVKVGVLEKEARDLNRSFLTYITRRRPYVTVKVAQSLDGKIATRSGDSRWISGEPARQIVHLLRKEVDAVLVGVNTVLRDDPLLLARPGGKVLARQPKRIILDRFLRTPLASKLVRSARRFPLLLAVGEDVPQKRLRRFEGSGVQFVKVKPKGRYVDLKRLLRRLAGMEVAHLLIEGGGTVIAEAIKQKVVDEFYCFIAPKIIGGKEAPTSVEGEGIRRMADALPLRQVRWCPVGQDFLIYGRVS